MKYVLEIYIIIESVVLYVSCIFFWISFNKIKAMMCTSAVPATGEEVGGSQSKAVPVHKQETLSEKTPKDKRNGLWLKW
jgi:hypothetical protein